MPLDPRLEPLRTLLVSDDDPILPPEARRQAGAQRSARLAGTLSGLGPDMAIEDVTVPTGPGGVPVRIYRPRGGVLAAHVNIHGGGWWTGSIAESDHGCRRRALLGDCAVVAIDYRLAPEHPFPAGLDDCEAVCRWLVDDAEQLAIDPGRIVLGGGSAGANLAVAVALRLRDTGGPRFAGLLLESAGLDLADLDTPSMREYGEDHGFSMALIRECIAFYTAGHPATDPLVSPVYADLHGLPETLITTMECDPFRDGAELFAERAQAAGVDVTLRRFVGMAHGCAELDVLVPEVAAAYNEVVQGFLGRLLHGARVRA